MFAIFCQPKNCHLLTSKGFSCYLWWHFPYLETSDLQISNKRVPIWPCCLGVFVFMCFCFCACLVCCLCFNVWMFVFVWNWVLYPLQGQNVPHCGQLLRPVTLPPPSTSVYDDATLPIYIIYISFLYILILLMIFTYFADSKALLIMNIRQFLKKSTFWTLLFVYF